MDLELLRVHDILVSLVGDDPLQPRRCIYRSPNLPCKTRIALRDRYRIPVLAYIIMLRGGKVLMAWTAKTVRLKL